MPLDDNGNVYNVFQNDLNQIKAQIESAASQPVK